ncbi:transcriptional regulator with XRE-family HTH domain [Allostreptomyces psammosilenae]|uniref:Transcriptional regulator with XRE-family HTH domain n=1 Tax=Allostreptomyces psammosilenae TaxID=1892865 RepID=A0A852ZXV8_9ACTN|nr:helix-turn-helix transcriptional regulator [Allostreptomyces psammosilenae]NYI03471.1 transcriptional regulator with XRE-family HTH domain [Allostreptomyces psammosilenae]
MSSHAPNRARVIHLRPATTAPAPTAEARAGDRAGDTTPGGTRSAAQGGAPGGAREPLWRHVLGDVLRRERLAQERTLKDVADTARISMPYLSEVERGRKEASSEVLAAAAQALGLSLADLLALAQGELARVARARAAGPRTASGPVAPKPERVTGRAVATGDDDGSATSVTELGARRTGARVGVRWGDVRLAA